MNLVKIRIRRSQRGFSIIEALIAGLVLSFGTLALVGVQVAMTRSSDAARQRTEATRLAQVRMEQLRAFASATVVAGVPSYEGMPALLTESIQNHDANNGVQLHSTVFTRTSTVGGAGTDVHRPVSVAVAWTDRGGEIQEVRLSSVIAKANHFKVGLIMANVGGTGRAGIVRQRNNNVPYPAVSIGGNKSTYQWPNQTAHWYVFDDLTANVEYRCTAAPTSAANLATDPACTQILAYVLSGYVSSNTSNGANDNIDTVLSPWGINACSFTNTSNLQGTPSCFVENVVVPNPVPPPCTPTPCTYPTLVINPDCPYLVSSIAPSPAQLQGLKFYKCYAALIEVPLGSTAGWTGRLEFNMPNPVSNRKVCRYNHLLVDTTTGIYDDVDESLNNENYFARLTGNCAGGQAQHQP